MDGRRRQHSLPPVLCAIPVAIRRISTTLVLRVVPVVIRRASMPYPTLSLRHRKPFRREVRLLIIQEYVNIDFTWCCFANFPVFQAPENPLDPAQWTANMERLNLVAPSDSVSQVTPASSSEQEPTRPQRVYQYCRDLDQIYATRHRPSPDQDVVVPGRSLGPIVDSYLVSFGYDLASRLAIFDAYWASRNITEFVSRLSGRGFAERELRWLWEYIVTDDEAEGWYHGTKE